MTTAAMDTAPDAAAPAVDAGKETKPAAPVKLTPLAGAGGAAVRPLGAMGGPTNGVRADAEALVQLVKRGATAHEERHVLRALRALPRVRKTLSADVVATLVHRHIPAGGAGGGWGWGRFLWNRGREGLTRGAPQTARGCWRSCRP
jgi:hypothetical protein